MCHNPQFINNMWKECKKNRNLSSISSYNILYFGSKYFSFLALKFFCSACLTDSPLSIILIAISYFLSYRLLYNVMLFSYFLPCRKSMAYFSWSSMCCLVNRSISCFTVMSGVSPIPSRFSPSGIRDIHVLV